MKLIADSQNHWLQMLDSNCIYWHILDLPEPNICPWDGAWLSKRGERWFIDSMSKKDNNLGSNVLHKLVLEPTPVVIACPPSPPHKREDQ